MTQTASKGFTFKINGIEISTEHPKIVAHTILELAEKRGAIPGDLDGYIIQGDKARYKGDDLVDLQEEDLFIAIPNTPTPVA